MASNILTSLVKHYEGLHDGNLSKIGLQPKLCPAGYWTIGYGHAIILNGKLADHTVPYSKIQALTLFDEEVASDLLGRDLSVFTTQVIGLIDDRTNLTQSQIDACISFSFNLGIGQFEISTLLKRINKNQLQVAAAEFPKWINAIDAKTKKTGPMPGLVARRKSEQHLFLTGELKFFN